MAVNICILIIGHTSPKYKSNIIISCVSGCFKWCFKLLNSQIYFFWRVSCDRSSVECWKIEIPWEKETEWRYWTPKPQWKLNKRGRTQNGNENSKALQVSYADSQTRNDAVWRSARLNLTFLSDGLKIEKAATAGHRRQVYGPFNKVPTLSCSPLENLTLRQRFSIHGANAGSAGGRRPRDRHGNT